MPPPAATAVSAAHVSPAEVPAPALGASPALRDSAIVLVGSRLLVWVAGCTAALLLGTVSSAVRAFDPAAISTSFGAVGNILAAPAIRWDGIWYLQIARSGYRNPLAAAFYPLYPLAVHVASWLTGSLPVAALVVSLAAMLAGLVAVHRLTELELGPRCAKATVRLMAFGPMAVFLSAAYTESLFLALSAGTLYCSRRGRWAYAGLLGGLAALTRVTGVALLLPVLVLFLYGPRADAAPRAPARWWTPRHRLSWQILWALLIPVAALGFNAYLSLRGHGLTSTVSAQGQYLDHDFALPFVTAWNGLVAGWQQLTLELRGVSPLFYRNQELFQSVSLLLALCALVGVLRRLPVAYGAYVAGGLLLTLSYPTSGDPLRGLARYASVLFPLQMWAGAWAIERRLDGTLVRGGCLLLVLFTIQFATWHVVGAPLV